MNKKGVMWEELADTFLGGSILFIAIVSFLLVTGLHENRIDAFFEQKISNLDNDEIFVSYLNAKLDNNIGLGDQIIISYINDDDELKEHLDMFLEKVYSSKVCWKLYRENEKWMEKNECRREETILNSTVFMPLPNEEILKIGLHVRGYAK